MRTAIAFALVVVVGLVGTSAARAQSRDQERLPLAPAFDYQKAGELAQHARAKKISGGLLIGAGTVVSVVGQLLLFANLIQGSIGSRDLNTLAVTCPDNLCVARPEGLAGVVLLVVGTAAVFAGIPVLTVGNAEQERARKLGGLAFDSTRPRLTF